MQGAVLVRALKIAVVRMTVLHDPKSQIGRLQAMSTPEKDIIHAVTIGKMGFLLYLLLLKKK
jgi:hypothetical protein